MSHDWAFCSRLFLVVAVVDGFSPALTNLVDGVFPCGWRFLSLYCSRVLSSVMSTFSWCHRYLPWISAVFHPDSMCDMVPFPPKACIVGPPSCPTCANVLELGACHTARSRKEIRNGSNFHRSAHVIFLLGRSHLVQAPWDASSTALELRLSSSRFCTSSGIMALFSLLYAFPHCWKLEVLRLCLPVHGIPIMSHSFIMLSACATEVSAAHLRPVIY